MSADPVHYGDGTFKPELTYDVEYERDIEVYPEHSGTINAATKLTFNAFVADTFHRLDQAYLRATFTWDQGPGDDDPANPNKIHARDDAALVNFPLHELITSAQLYIGSTLVETVENLRDKAWFKALTDSTSSMNVHHSIKKGGAMTAPYKNALFSASAVLSTDVAIPLSDLFEYFATPFPKYIPKDMKIIMFKQATANLILGPNALKASSGTHLARNPATITLSDVIMYTKQVEPASRYSILKELKTMYWPYREVITTRHTAASSMRIVDSLPKTPLRVVVSKLPSTTNTLVETRPLSDITRLTVEINDRAYPLVPYSSLDLQRPFMALRDVSDGYGPSVSYSAWSTYNGFWVVDILPDAQEASDTECKVLINLTVLNSTNSYISVLYFCDRVVEISKAGTDVRVV